MAVTVLDLFRPHMYVVQFNNLHYELRERECVCVWGGGTQNSAADQTPDSGLFWHYESVETRISKWTAQVYC